MTLLAALWGGGLCAWRWLAWGAILGSALPQTGPQERMEFLKEDLTHLFDDQGACPCACPRGSLAVV